MIGGAIVIGGEIIIAIMIMIGEADYNCRAQS